MTVMRRVLSRHTEILRRLEERSGVSAPADPLAFRLVSIVAQSITAEQPKTSRAVDKEEKNIAEGSVRS